MSEQPQWLQDHLAKLHAEQDGKSREEVTDSLQARTEHVFDPETATPQRHNWVDRGMKMTCEGAEHPYHEAWKRRAPKGYVPM